MRKHIYIVVISFIIVTSLPERTVYAEAGAGMQPPPTQEAAIHTLERSTAVIEENPFLVQPTKFKHQGSSKSWLQDVTNDQEHIGQ